MSGVSESCNDDRIHHNVLQRSLRASLPASPAVKCFPLHAFCSNRTNYMPPGFAGCNRAVWTDVVLRYAGQEATTSLTGTFEVIPC